VERVTLVLVVSTDSLNDTTHRTLGEYFEALPWIERFDGNTLVKKCPGEIAPDLPEANGACGGSPKRTDYAQSHRT